jgi:hypothetical protein
LFEALCLMLLASVAVGLLHRILRKIGLSLWIRAVGWLSAPAALWFLLGLPSAQEKVREQNLLNEGWTSYSRDLGRALDQTLPSRAVLFLALDRDPPGQFETHNLMFYSGRMVYGRSPDVRRAKEMGLHPYLISPRAEPFEPVAGVPAGAWLRAYDLLSPAPPPSIPEDAQRVEPAAAGVQAFASADAPGKLDRWTFFVAPDERRLAPIPITFHLRNGGRQRRVLSPGDVLVSPRTLSHVPWYVQPSEGPDRSEVLELEIGDNGKRIPVLQ